MRGVRLHLGCGDRTPAGWLNVDNALGARLLQLPLLGSLLRALGIFGIDWSRDVALHDLRRPFPWAERSVDAIYSSHTLEHLTRSEGTRFLHECNRVLRPGGVLRIVVPDLRPIVEAYRRGELAACDFLDQLGTNPVLPTDGRIKRWLAPLVRHPHRCMYDPESLCAAMASAGFDVELAEPSVSRIADIAALEGPDWTRGGVIAEGTRSPARGPGA